MVDAVKVFLLHLQLKAFVVKGDLLEKLLLDLISSPSTDESTPIFRSFICKLWVRSLFRIWCSMQDCLFQCWSQRHLYLIPVSRGRSGRLILAEKHRFRSQRGVVIAIAPLAGLSPKKDEDHPTWLHLRLREFDPRSNVSKTRGHNSNTSNSAVDGRWTLGFTSAHPCEAACLLILEETCKQRSIVETILAPLLQDDYLGNVL